MSKANIKAIITEVEGKRTCVINQYGSLNIEQKEEVNTVHIANVLHTALLEELRKNEQLVLPAGEYHISLSISLVNTDE